MIPRVLAVQATLEAVDGGSTAADIPTWQVVTVQGGYIGGLGLTPVYSILLLRWVSAQKIANGGGSIRPWYGQLLCVLFS
jgi:hypothetical protein